MEDRLARIRKFSGVAQGIVGVIQIILAVAFIGGIVDAVRLGTNGGAGLALQGVPTLVGLAGAFWVLVMVSFLLKNLRREETPFAPDNVRRLRHIGVTLMLLAILLFIADVVRSFTWYALPPELSLLTGQPLRVAGIAENRIAFSYIPLIVVVVGLVVLCVALAFEHGALLQQQSDETL